MLQDIDNVFQPVSTDRFRLRLWEDRDVEGLIEMGADEDVMRFYPNLRSPEKSAALHARFMEKQQNAQLFEFVIASRENDEFLGYCGLNTLDLSGETHVEINWGLRRAYWGNGLATEASLIFLEHGFRRLNLHEIISLTPLKNLPSQRVMKRLGMIRDEAEDFDYPDLPVGHPLGRYVIFRLNKQQFLDREDV